MIETLDSYYIWIRQQLNGNAKLGGIVQASAWPQLPIQDKTLYLIVVSTQPSKGQQNGSVSSQLLEFSCQWTWISIGTDIKSTQQAMNRGDRYRANTALMKQLNQASFPGFAIKQTTTADPVTGAITTVPYSTAGGMQSIWWNRLKFRMRSDNDQSGLLYTTATTEIYGYEDVLDGVSSTMWVNAAQIAQEAPVFSFSVDGSVIGTVP